MIIEQYLKHTWYALPNKPVSSCWSTPMHFSCWGFYQQALKYKRQSTDNFKIICIHI